MYIPVALFTYNRLQTLKATLESLNNNYLADQTDIFIYSDGPKNSNDCEKVNNVRNFIRNFKGFNKITIIEREFNLGLGKNIISGINNLFSMHNSIIVLEDDIVTSKYFLEFMNQALRIYEKDNKVCQVSGYSYLQNYSNKYQLDKFYFIKGADCMAFGTWKSSWSNFSDDAKYLYEEIKKRNLIKSFNRNNSYNYLKMLKARSENKNNSWAICWYATNFLRNKYCFYPLNSFALHIGNKTDATNYIPVSDDKLNVKLNDQKEEVITVDVFEKKNTRLAYEEFLKELRGSFFERLKSYIKVFMRKNALL